MSQKTYCDSCSKEIDSKGNSYLQSQKELDKFKVHASITPRYSDIPADLCADCTKKLLRLAYA